MADRRELLAAQSAVTGLDFVVVQPDEVTLDVHFLRPPATLDTPLPGNLDAGHIHVTPIEPGDPTVEITGLAWLGSPGSEDVLRLTTASPGGFSDYVLTIDDARIDPYFSALRFNFKANCPSDLNCEPPCPDCPPDELVDYPVDYQARDYWSYRRALLDFAAHRYPDWQERAEADFGVMLAEVMSALADEMAYYQDHIAREAYLETASQRRSLRRHARLVDYDIHDGRGATGWLIAQASAAGNVPAGTAVWAASADGTRIDFSVGTGLRDQASYDIAPALNALRPHQWDQSDVCLAAGATQLDLEGAHAADLVFKDPPSDPTGRWVVLQTDPADPGVAQRTELVRITSVSELPDPLLGTTVTRVGWESVHVTHHEMEMATLQLYGNLLPVTAGSTQVQRFTIGPSSDSDDRPSAVERQGRLIEGGAPCDCGEQPCPAHSNDRTITYLFTLPQTAEEGLVWLGDPVENAEPELLLSEVTEAPLGIWTASRSWEFRHSFIGSGGSSLPQDAHYVLDDGTWERIVGYWRNGTEIVHVDYAGPDGISVRFGDGEFGRIPDEGTVFQATYRVGNGQQGNLPAGAISNADPSVSFLASVRNPFPTAGGLDPESPEETRMLAPERFRAETLRAVRPEDYADAVERLPWVQRAGASFRWTGSWLSAFVTPDPLGSLELAPAQATDASRQLDRFRQAGRQTYVSRPKYADLDLSMEVCAKDSSFAGDVRAAVIDALFGTSGFFSPDRFTFGTPFDRSALEAAVQSVPGVLAVRDVQVRRRGWFDWRELSELVYQVADDEIVRIENDPDHPTRGIFTLTVDGGA